MKPLYLITGCGVTGICQQGSEGMLWFINQIIRKGGVPTITPYNGEPMERAA